MLSINFSELIWTIINFFLLFFLLRRFLFDPICRFMDARQAKIDAGLSAEREAQSALKAAEDELAEQKAQARREAAALLSAAAAADEKRTQEAWLHAQDEAAARQKAGEDALREQNAREAAALKAGEPELAALLAARLLGKED